MTTWKEKYRNTPDENVVVGYDGTFPIRVGIAGSEDAIRYAYGPAKVNGHCVWKPCTHTKVGVAEGHLGSYDAWLYASHTEVTNLRVPRRALPHVGEIPRCPFDTSVYQKIADQLDLNCEDSVLLYSGILQAVPLVGGAFKFVSILNQAASRLSKSFKKKPFTTVVKTLISGDFIDRFVIRPTIDDARKFLDASNYVLRVLDTAYTRNAMPSTLKAETTTIVSDSTSSFSMQPTSIATAYVDTHVVRQRRTQAFGLFQMNYNTKAISPIKLWATRVGLYGPLESAWDLVPFSFVIDYFSRAGEFISDLTRQLSSQDGLKGRITNVYGFWGATSETVRAEYTLNRVVPRNSYVHVYNVMPKTEVRTWQRYDRFELSPDALNQTVRESKSFLQWDLSLTRYRTLAQLFLQSRL